MSLEKVLRWAAIGGLFLVPFIVLYVAQSLFFPFITGKNFAFRIVIEVVGGAWLALAVVYPHYRPRRSWIFLALTAFVIALGIADVFGVNPAKSLWSNYERMEGWVTLAHLLVFFAVVVSLFDEKLWKRWWQTSLGVSALVACYGLIQLLGFATIHQSGVRLDASLGNSTYLAVYMLFHVFIAALFLARARMELRPGKGFVPLWGYGTLIILNTFILFFTATRGAMLGLIGGALLTSLLLIALAPRSRVAWRAGVGVCALILVAAVFWLARDTAFIRSIEPLQRLASISLSETTVNSRVMNAGMAWQGFKERPLLGWGQENYAVVFDKYYNPQMYAQEPWFDRVHNVIFDWLIAGGILGLLAYLALYGTALFALWRSSAFASHERAILTGLLGGYFFYLLFTFDNLTSYILFIALLAYIAMRAAPNSSRLWSRAAVPATLLPFVAVGAVLLVWGTVWFVNTHALVANQTLIQALSPQSAGLAHNLKLFQEALARDSFGTQEVREHLAQGAMNLARNAQVPLEVKQAFFTTTVTEMAAQETVAPLNARFPLLLGSLLNAYGDLDGAKTALERARDRSPNKQAIRFELGLNALARGDSAEALNIFEEAYALAPEYPEARILYTSVALRAGDFARAEGLLAALSESGRALDPRIIGPLVNLGRYQVIEHLAAKHIQRFPEDFQSRLTHLAALFAQGKRTEALEVLAEARTKFPESASQLDAIEQEIVRGTLKIE